MKIIEDEERINTSFENLKVILHLHISMNVVEKKKTKIYANIFGWYSYDDVYEIA